MPLTLGAMQLLDQVDWLSRCPSINSCAGIVRSDDDTGVALEALELHAKTE